MAMYDWNHNGKNEMQDDYLEYMIYKDSTNDNNSNTNHSSYLSLIHIQMCIRDRTSGSGK